MKVLDRIVHWTQVRIRWATIVVKRIVRFVTHDMWYLNMTPWMTTDILITSIPT